MASSFIHRLDSSRPGASVARFRGRRSGRQAARTPFAAFVVAASSQPDSATSDWRVPLAVHAPAAAAPRQDVPKIGALPATGQPPVAAAAEVLDDSGTEYPLAHAQGVLGLQPSGP